MTEDNRLTAMDFVISVIAEHEKKLDFLVSRLEAIVEAPVEGITFTARLAKSGNSVAVNIMKNIRDLTGLKAGDDVEVSLRKL